MGFNVALTSASHRLTLCLKALTGGSLNKMAPLSDDCKIGQYYVTSLIIHEIDTLSESNMLQGC